MARSSNTRHGHSLYKLAGANDELTQSIRFQGAAKKQAFAANIEITYEEHR